MYIYTLFTSKRTYILLYKNLVITGATAESKEIRRTHMKKAYKITIRSGVRKDLKKKKLLLSSNGHKKGTEKTYFFLVSVVSSIVAPMHSIELHVLLL